MNHVRVLVLCDSSEWFGQFFFLQFAIGKPLFWLISVCSSCVCGRLGSLPVPLFSHIRCLQGTHSTPDAFTPLCFWFLTMSYFPLFTRLAEEKKEEGNQLYKLKSYRDALAKYSEAIGKFILQLDTSMWNKISKFTGKKHGWILSFYVVFFFWPCQQPIEWK